jgi:imidazolonepropionase-like amidohydrolase
LEKITDDHADRHGHQMTPALKLRAIEVWDGEGERGPCDVDIDGGVFTSVQPARTAAVAELSLIPGLIDTHVHLLGNADPDGDDFYSWPLTTTREEQVLHGLAQAQRAQRAGVTTVRDLSADTRQVAISRAIDAGIVTGARVITHGMVSMTGGHQDLFTPPAITDRAPVADGVDACRQLVRLYARNGLHGIKVATSGGVLSIGDRHAWRNHTDAEIAVIVDEAHALGMRVAAHAHTADGIARALTHGVDSLEHATLMSADLAEQAAKQGVTVAPTLLINDVIASGAVSTPAATRQKAAELVARRDGLLADAYRRGVRFVLGTDANGYHVRFGDQMREMQRMADVLGAEPADVLRAGTSRAAQVVGRASTIGRVDAGYAADAVVIRGRPWERQSDLSVDNIVAVIARGIIVRGALAPN